MDVNLRFQKEKIKFAHNKDLSGLTFFRTMGRAEYFYEPKEPEDLIEALEYAHRKGMPVSVIGSGTHVIISDEGIKGLLISTKRIKGMTIKGNLVTAYCGESLNDVINVGIEHNLMGLEELGGIPGTIAAALKVNATSQGKSISDYHFYSDYLTLDGKLHRRPDYKDFFGNQMSEIEDDEIVLSVTLKLEPSKRTAEARMRKERFVELMFIPPTNNFVGQVFKDPEGMKASQIIKDLNLDRDLGLEVEFPPFQSNSIFGYQDARAKDVYRLIRYVQNEAKDKLGVELKLSVGLLGEFK